MTRTDPQILKRRHPLCPYCGYDLVAAYAGRPHVCPECGETVEPADLRWESRAGDWTLLTALRLAGKALAMRGLIALPVCAALSALDVILVNFSAPRITLLILAVAHSAALAAILSRRLTEQAGFDGVVLTIAVCVMALALAVMGQAVAEWIVTPKLPLAGVLYVGFVCAGALVMIIYAAFMEHM